MQESAGRAVTCGGDPAKVFAETKVNYAYMTVRFDEDVPRLEVSVNDFLAMQKFYSNDLIYRQLRAQLGKRETLTNSEI